MIKFAQQFVLHPKEVGALFPSSDALVDKICEYAKLDEATTVVEIGTGTGAITKQIVKRLHKDAIFFGIEILPHLVKESRKKCPETKIFEGSGTELKKFLEEMNLEQVNTVVCGVPWANLNPKLQNELMAEILKSMPKGGRFVQFGYIHGLALDSGKNFRKLLDKNFSKVTKSKTIWKSFPPAFVYKAIK